MDKLVKNISSSKNSGGSGEDLHYRSPDRQARKLIPKGAGIVTLSKKDAWRKRELKNKVMISSTVWIDDFGAGLKMLKNAKNEVLLVKR